MLQLPYEVYKIFNEQLEEAVIKVLGTEAHDYSDRALWLAFWASEHWKIYFGRLSKKHFYTKKFEQLKPGKKTTIREDNLCRALIFIGDQFPERKYKIQNGVIIKMHLADTYLPYLSEAFVKYTFPQNPEYLQYFAKRQSSKKFKKNTTHKEVTEEVLPEMSVAKSRFQKLHKSIFISEYYFEGRRDRVYMTIEVENEFEFKGENVVHFQSKNLNTGGYYYTKEYQHMKMRGAFKDDVLCSYFFNPEPIRGIGVEVLKCNADMSILQGNWYVDKDCYPDDRKGITGPIMYRRCENLKEAELFLKEIKKGPIPFFKDWHNETIEMQRSDKWG